MQRLPRRGVLLQGASGAALEGTQGGLQGEPQDGCRQCGHLTRSCVSSTAPDGREHFERTHELPFGVRLKIHKSRILHAARSLAHLPPLRRRSAQRLVLTPSPAQRRSAYRQTRSPRRSQLAAAAMAKPPGAPALPFANDGSFMEQFMKARAPHCDTACVALAGGPDALASASLVQMQEEAAAAKGGAKGGKGAAAAPPSADSGAAAGGSDAPAEAAGGSAPPADAAGGVAAQAAPRPAVVRKKCGVAALLRRAPAAPRCPVALTQQRARQEHDCASARRRRRRASGQETKRCAPKRRRGFCARRLTPRCAADEAPAGPEGGLSAHYLAEMRKFQSLSGEKTSASGRPLLK